MIRESTVDGFTYRWNEKDNAWERVSGSMDKTRSVYYFDEYGQISEIYEVGIEMVNTVVEVRGTAARH